MLQGELLLRPQRLAPQDTRVHHLQGQMSGIETPSAKSQLVLFAVAVSLVDAPPTMTHPKRGPGMLSMLPDGYELNRAAAKLFCSLWVGTAEPKF